jgi:hypothetical protein
VGVCYRSCVFEHCTHAFSIALPIFCCNYDFAFYYRILGPWEASAHLIHLSLCSSPRDSMFTNCWINEWNWFHSFWDIMMSPSPKASCSQTKLFSGEEGRQINFGGNTFWFQDRIVMVRVEISLTTSKSWLYCQWHLSLKNFLNFSVFMSLFIK